MQKWTSWSDINERIRDTQFRVIFWMSHNCLTPFHSVSFLQLAKRSLNLKHVSILSQMTKTVCAIQNIEHTSGYISGEVNLAIAIRLFASGDAYDLAVIFDVHFDHNIRIWHKLLLVWIIATESGDLDTMKYLGYKDAMIKVSADFSKQSNGVPKGAIAELGDWRVCGVRHNWFHGAINNKQLYSLRNDSLLSICNV